MNGRNYQDLIVCGTSTPPPCPRQDLVKHCIAFTTKVVVVIPSRGILLVLLILAYL